MLCSAQDILHPFNLDNTTSLCSSRMDGVKLFVQGKCRLTCRASDQFTISDVNIPQYCIDGIRSSSFDTRLLRRPVSFFVVRMGYNFVLVLFPKNTPSPW